MLTIIVNGGEFFNERTQEFLYSEDLVLELEHSLASLSKWESKFRKPFLSTTDKTDAEVQGYVEAMTLSSNFSPEVFSRLTTANLEEINDYVSSPYSATTFNEYGESKSRSRPEIITSELIYYWMTIYNIPFECEHWHLNRLFALLRICNIKNSKEKKMSRSAAAAQQRALNEQRKEQLGTRG